MIRSTRMTPFLAIAATVLLLSLPTALYAQLEASVEFDEANQEFDVVITGGSLWMEVHTTYEGCVDATAPSDSVLGSGTISVPLSCVQVNSDGWVRVETCLAESAGGACFDQKEFYLKCDGLCHIWEVDYVPTTTEWGIIVLLVLTTATGVYLIYRRRAVTAR